MRPKTPIEWRLAKAMTAVIALLVITAACGNDEPAAGPDLCGLVEGSTFVSEEKSSSVMTEDGAVATTEELEFYEGGVDRFSGDTIDSYEWNCADGVVTWVDGFFEATISAENDSLVLTEPDGFRWLGPPTD